MLQNGDPLFSKSSSSFLPPHSSPTMAVFLLKIIFSALTMFSNIVSRVIFTVTAYLLVIVIQAFKVPGEALKDGLEQLGNVIKACLEYFLELVMEAVSTLVSSLFDLVVEGIFSSVVATGSAIGGLMDKMRTSLDGLLESVPEVMEGFSEMVSTMVSDLWNNYMDAMGYVTENA